MSTIHKDVEMWNNWKDSNFKSKTKLRALLKEVNPIVQHQVNKWKPPTLPRSAVEAEAMNITMSALPEYDPNRGIKMNTFLTNKLKKLSRYVYKNQNMGAIPEHRILKIDGYKKAKAVLLDKLGREPAASEMADHMMVPMKFVATMEKELNKNIITSDLISTHAPKGNDPEDYDELIEFVYMELSPIEKLVYEYSLGKHGKKELNGIQMARKLRISPSAVTRHKNAIKKKINKYRRGI